MNKKEKQQITLYKVKKVIIQEKSKKIQVKDRFSSLDDISKNKIKKELSYSLSSESCNKKNIIENKSKSK